MLKRHSLREQICDELRKQILSGKLNTESGISEISLAKELGVSRTPLREALISLENEGFLEASPGKGFAVLPLTFQEYSDIVSVIGVIEELALLSCETFSTEELEELREINRDFAKTDQIADSTERQKERVRLDLMWHDLLLEKTSNKKTLCILSKLKFQWRRYEYSFFSSKDSVQKSVEEHTKIIETLADGDLKKAAKLLKQQWPTCASFEKFLSEKRKRSS